VAAFEDLVRSIPTCALRPEADAINAEHIRMLAAETTTRHGYANSLVARGIPPPKPVDGKMFAVAADLKMQTRIISAVGCVGPASGFLCVDDAGVRDRSCSGGQGYLQGGAAFQPHDAAIEAAAVTVGRRPSWKSPSKELPFIRRWNSSPARPSRRFGWESGGSHISHHVRVHGTSAAKGPSLV